MSNAARPSRASSSAERFSLSGVSRQLAARPGQTGRLAPDSLKARRCHHGRLTGVGPREARHHRSAKPLASRRPRSCDHNARRRTNSACPIIEPWTGCLSNRAFMHPAEADVPTFAGGAVRELAVGLMPSGMTQHRPPEAFITAGLTIELGDKSDISVRGSIFRVQRDDTIKHLLGRG